MDKTILYVVAGVIVVSAIASGDDGTALRTVSAVSDEKAPDSRTPNVTATSNGQFTTTRAPDGHFYANAQVNGRSIRMMIDTGASSVVLSRADARRAGINVDDKDGFTERANTAGGSIAIMPVTLGQMSVGSLSERNVPAFVAQSDLGISLIGQSFLQRVDNVEIVDNQIRLR